MPHRSDLQKFRKFEKELEKIAGIREHPEPGG
jgi:hypothetical protein